MLNFGKILGWIFASSLKFAPAPPTMLLMGYSFWETIIITIIGGTAGVLFFYYIGGAVFNKLWNFILKILKIKKKENPKKFTFKNKLIINAKGRFGLIGLSLLTPTLISIPIGSILAAKYFKYNPRAVPYLLLSVVLWSFVLTSFTAFIKPLFN